MVPEDEITWRISGHVKNATTCLPLMLMSLSQIILKFYPRVCFKISRVRKFRVKAKISSWHFLSDVYIPVENVQYSAAPIYLGISKILEKYIVYHLGEQQGALGSILDYESRDGFCHYQHDPGKLLCQLRYPFSHFCKIKLLE